MVPAHVSQSESLVQIYISLGSNINPSENIAQATNTLCSALEDWELSPLYQSHAVGMNGADFLNSVIGGKTTKELNETQLFLKKIEEQQGRVKTYNKYSDRTLDLDLLLYGNISSNKLPHREIVSEAYVLQPLCDIAPDLIHPSLGKSIYDLRNELLAKTPEKFSSLSIVEKYNQL